MKNEKTKNRLPDGPVPLREAASLLGLSEREMRSRCDGWRVLTVKVRGQRLIPLNEIRGQMG
jgi:hypothetical protein